MPEDVSLNELIRRLENIVRAGTVAAVDHARARCRVTSGNLTTDFLPWFVSRAGDVRDWSPPFAGEQCIVLCPGGDMASAVVLVGLNSDAFPAPGDSATLDRREYPDGAHVDYDHAAHALTVVLPPGGTADITAPASVIVRSAHITLDAPESNTTGNLTVEGLLSYQAGMVGRGRKGGVAAMIEGSVHATEDVRASDVSLVAHVHGGVQSGGDRTGRPA